MIMAIKDRKCDVPRVNQSIYVKNSNWSIDLGNTFWDDFRYWDHGIHHKKVGPLSLKMEPGVFFGSRITD